MTARELPLLPLPGRPLAEQPVGFRLRALLDVASADPSFVGLALRVFEELILEAADLIDAQQATIDEQADEIARLNRIVLTADAVIERLAGQPCKYVATDPEGTSYCTLNGRASDGGDL